MSRELFPWSIGRRDIATICKTEVDRIAAASIGIEVASELCQAVTSYLFIALVTARWRFPLRT